MIDDIGLTVNVITPPDATPESRLPVVVVSFEPPLPIFILIINNHEQWFYPGAFQFGGTVRYVLEFLGIRTTVITYDRRHDGNIIVEKAISLGVPAIFVSMNYR